MTTPIVPAPIVPAPGQLRRRYGLFDAASGPLDLPGHGEGGGVRFVPDNCGSSIAYGVACYGGENPAPEKPSTGDAEEVQTGVFAALTALMCSATGYTLAEYQAKVRRRLEGSEMAAVEAALWTGLDFEGNPLGILNLSEEAEPVDAGYDEGSIASVLGALERYAYTEQGYGGVAYVHAPIEVAAFAGHEGLIEMDGSGPNARRLTPAGSVWAFGAYPSGSIIVTGQTTVWRSPEIASYDAFDTATNQRLLVAERAYSVAFECFAGEAEYNPLGVS